MGSIFTFRNQWPSLEPIMRIIDLYHDPSPQKSPPEGWTQGNGSITSPSATVTHNKHRDRQHHTEVFIEETFGREKHRVRIAIKGTMNKPSGVHEGRIKETRYAYKGQEVLIIRGEIYTFTIMGAWANGKKSFFDSADNGTDDSAISLLHKNYSFEEDEDEDCTTNPGMTHGVYNSGGAFSAMF